MVYIKLTDSYFWKRVKCVTIKYQYLLRNFTLVIVVHWQE